ncbi:DUF6884 domain-containing protein [Nocardia sp. NPDC058176]|uniref:DUF6884 domain-containing protein n=1 Tax=Nocardia sp. NPDC058176 TaxID=3346368 RepID=UPI0036DB74A1
MTGPLVLVACGARKADHPRPARDLYTGSYTRMCLQAALILAPAEQVRIVSARHGLVELATVLDPYDTAITDPDAITADELHEQATEHQLLGRDVIVFGGAKYTTLVRQVWPYAVAPLAGQGGIGYQLRYLAGIIAAGPPRT